MGAGDCLRAKKLRCKQTEEGTQQDFLLHKLSLFNVQSQKIGSCGNGGMGLE
jgi:hypothetical protein